MELVILLIIGIFVITYRKNDGEKIYETFLKGVTSIYDKYAPYSFKTVREKSIELGEEYTAKQYITQVILFGGFGAGVGYLYFYSIIWAIFYGVAAVMFIPYLAYLRCQRIYSEFIFEQIQVYTTNVIMEFNQKYPYYMVKNMHQLFLQITKEGARDSGESLENMLLDIDQLVEGVYRDKMDRETFHKRFLTFGFALYLLVMLTQTLLGVENYIDMLKKPYVSVILHLIIIVNSYFLLNGEKYYNEDTGGE